MKLFSTLRRTLSLHFLLVAILPSLALGLLAIGLLHKHLRNGIYERNQQISTEIAAATDQFLQQAEHDLEAVARLLQSDSIIQPGAIDSFLEKIVQEPGWIESIYRLDSRRRVINLGFAPKTGLSRADYLDVDFSSHPIFLAHPVVDQPVWSDSFVSLATGEPSVTLAVPLSDGVLLGNVSLQYLNRQLSRFAMSQNDVCAVVDHAGTIVASSTPALASQRVNLVDHPVIAQTTPEGGKTVLDRHDNRLMLESTAPVGRTGWIAWVGVDFGARMMPVDHVRNLLLAVLFMALILASAIALWDAQRLLFPLSALSERTGRIGAGDYEFDDQSSGFVEIDALSASLKGMSAAVNEREQSLISSERRFRGLVNSIDGVVWEMDVSSGRYLFVSERSADMLGYPPERWAEDPDFWSRHVSPEDAERIVIRGRRSLALNEKHDLEYRFVTASGDPIWVRDLVTVIWEEDEPVRLLGVMIDITERKAAEVELENYRLGLESLVAMKTRELQAAQNELVQKERLAVLGQLTATVSHEIRNPLGTVSNALYLMREMLGDECLVRVERPLVLAERNVERCDSIISELLDFTRRRVLQREAVPLDAWLTGVLDEMTWREDLVHVWHLASGVTILADPERLRRAVVNVINNAVQAIEAKGEGGGVLEISTGRSEDRCEIIVRDNGCGIPAENLERIFEPLFSTKNFGVGLGVPIIRNIMQDHGGGVSYQSEVGKGTTATLWLPLTSSHTEE